MSDTYDGTMFAALHGELAVHPWRAHASSDAYSLFVARSSAMGWLTEAVETAYGGFWGMNDAGQDSGAGAGPSRVAWFQVSLTEPLVTVLPVQPFLACAGDVVARIGALRLDAVQALLPVQSLGASDNVMTLLQDAGWFADGDPRLRTQVRVTLDGGQDPAIHEVAPEMLRWTAQLEQRVFSYEGRHTGEDAGLEPGIIDELWNGPAQHRVSWRGGLVEWSLDAVGWLAAFLGEASYRYGVSAPLLLTVTRS